MWAASRPALEVLRIEDRLVCEDDGESVGPEDVRVLLEELAKSKAGER
jgi:hypothetical protein